MRRRSAGLTLIEILVACFLFTLATYVIFGLLDFGSRLYLSSDARSDTQRQGLRFIDRFQREVQNAPVAGTTLTYPSNNPNTGDLAISFLSNRDVNDQPVMEPGAVQPQYQAWQLYWEDLASQTLRSLRLPLAQPTLLVTTQGAPTLLASLSLPPSTTQVSGAVKWQALDYDTGVPLAIWQNPSRYQMTLVTTQGIQVLVEMRLKLLN